MPQNLLDEGAVLAHPAKAFVLRHIPLPGRYSARYWEDGKITYINATHRNPFHNNPELQDYVLRVQNSVDTLFGSMDFDLHTTRAYGPEGLSFHSDLEDVEDPDDLIRMATCIHNATDQDRPLHFKRPTWTNHTETFSLNVPAMKILAIGGELITEYEHGIPPGPDVCNYRSVITRFSRWK